MPFDVSGIQREHEGLLDQIEQIRLTARELPGLSPERRAELRDELVEFFRHTLDPHAKEEERELYPAVGRKLGHPDATAPMIYDHLAIKELAMNLAEADTADTDRLQELLYGLYALIRVHFWKEEELYLPLLEGAPAPGPATRSSRG